MPVNNMRTRSWYQGGDDWVTRTSEFNMVPGDIFVTATLSVAVGDAVQSAGIASISSVQSGTENFQFYWTRPAAAFRQGMSRLTVVLETSPDDSARGLFTLYIF